MGGTPPSMWGIVNHPTKMFHNESVYVRIPHTDYIRPCTKCHTSGLIQCTKCRGKCYRVCSNCDGKVQIRCRECNGSGKCSARRFGKRCEHGQLTSRSSFMSKSTAGMPERAETRREC